MLFKEEYIAAFNDKIIKNADEESVNQSAEYVPKMLFNEEAIRKINRDVLNRFAESMPNGEFIADCNGKISKCDCIAISNNGRIFPLYKTCALNPLYRDKDGRVHLSTFSCGGAFIQRSENIEEAIQIYNEELLEIIDQHIKDSSPFQTLLGDIIVAYHEF